MAYQFSTRRYLPTGKLFSSYPEFGPARVSLMARKLQGSRLRHNKLIYVTRRKSLLTDTRLEELDRLRGEMFGTELAHKNLLAIIGKEQGSSLIEGNLDNICYHVAVAHKDGDRICLHFYVSSFSPEFLGELQMEVTGDICHIKKLEVDFRFRQQSIATKLLHVCDVVSRACAYRGIVGQGMVSPGDAEWTCRFFEKAGFKVAQKNSFLSVVKNARSGV
jgi:GNAT superfamily N-acetyltransferase